MSAIGRKVRRKWRRRPSGSLAASIVLTVCIALLAPAWASAQNEQQSQSSDNSTAQSPQSQSAQNSERPPRRRARAADVLLSSANPVAAQNLALVAASTSQIRMVLAENPGLLIELKRLLAERATELGQVLTQDDLTNQAVDEKLDSDLKFRAEATLLLQRYGYLLPTVNPDSALGKEQGILIKQRALELAKLENEPPQAPPSTQAASACAPSPDSHCPAPGANYPAPAQTTPQGGLPRYPYPQAQPGIPEMPLAPPSNLQEVFASMPSGLGAGGMGAGLGSVGVGGLASEAGIDGMSGVSGYGESGLLGMQGAGMSAGLGGSLGAGGALGLSQQFSPFSYSSSQAGLMPGGIQPAIYNPGAYPPGANGYSLSNPYGWQNSYGWQNGQPYTEQPPQLVARRDPFANIPSLYDMYMQAAPQPAKLERFGIAIFRDTTASDEFIPMDMPVGPSYVVGPGDGLSIDLWGSVSTNLFRVVDRTGRIDLPEVGPVEVSGETLGDVQRKVQGLLRTQFRAISADVSVAEIRTVRVYVVGDVEHPGAYDVSSLSTPLNAVFAAGGPTRNGSIRTIQHWRGDKLLQKVDVYDLLLHGITGPIVPLSNGDTIRVPTVGPEVTVEGMVRRPAVYELGNKKTLAAVIQLAGGILPAATLKHIEVQRLVAHQHRIMLSLNISNSASPAAVEKQLAAFHVKDGDIVHVFPLAPYNQDAVYLEGHVLRPGKYAYHPGMKLTDLVTSYKDLLPQPSSYAEIIRLAPPDYRPQVQSFNLAAALRNPAKDPTLDRLDTVRIFSRYDFRDVPTVTVGGAVRQPGLYRTSGRIHLRDAIELAGGVTPDANMGSVQVFHYLPNSQMKVISVSLAKVMENDPRDNFMLGPRDTVLVHENLARSDPTTVYVEGAVAHPGRYPLAVGMRVSGLIQVAGGLKRSADERSADLTRYVWDSPGHISGEHLQVNLASALDDSAGSDPLLHNGDVLTIRQVAGWDDLGATIEVKGEVKHPGTYGIQPGEKLSTVLEQAGGFTSQAYPYGAILERQEVRQAEMKSYEELVTRVRESQAVLQGKIATPTPTDNENEKLTEEAGYLQWQSTLETLLNNPPLGRVVVQISPEIRRWAGSPQDIEVRSGDVLIIPKRPSAVMVQGQVYNPTAVAFRPGRSAKWYLKQAGGPTTTANKKGIFVIRADGSVVGSRGFSLWKGNPLDATLYPGDTVVVPEQPVKGPPQWKGIFQSAQILSSIVTSAVLVAHYY